MPTPCPFLYAYDTNEGSGGGPGQWMPIPYKSQNRNNQSKGHHLFQSQACNSVKLKDFENMASKNNEVRIFGEHSFHQNFWKFSGICKCWLFRALQELYIIRLKGIALHGLWLFCYPNCRTKMSTRFMERFTIQMEATHCLTTQPSR